MRDLNILVVPGDGIGPEVVKEGCKVLEALTERFGQRFELTEDTIGGGAIDRWGEPIRDETFMILFNPHHEPIRFFMPRKEGTAWELVMDSADPEKTESPVIAPGDPYELHVNWWVNECQDLSPFHSASSEMWRLRADFAAK